MALRIFLATIVGFAMIMMTSCTGSNKMYKRGTQLEAATLYREASNYYAEALSRKRDHIDAQIALKRTGQQVINDGLSTFFKAHSSGEDRTAVYTFLEVDAFYNRAESLGVHLDFPEFHRADYAEALDRYLHVRYTEAMSALDAESFEKAGEITSEITSLNPNYREIQDLNKRAVAEPRYREANQLMDAQKYRSAYYVYDKILQDFGSYRDSDVQKQYCLDKAQFKIAVLPFENTTDKKGYEDAVGALIAQDILDRNNPFIQLIDPARVEEILQNENYQPAAGFNSESLMNMGHLAGAHAVLSGQLITMRLQPGQASSKRVKGYRAYVVKLVNPQTGEKYSETRYDKVYYNEHANNNQVVLAFKYNLVSTETGQILDSELVQKTKNDYVHFATYNGDYRDLYPGFWHYLKKPHPEDKVYTSRKAYRDLQDLFKASRELRSIESLVSDGLNEIAEDIGASVVQFNPDL